MEKSINKPTSRLAALLRNFDYFPLLFYSVRRLWNSIEIAALNSLPETYNLKWNNALVLAGKQKPFSRPPTRIKIKRVASISMNAMTTFMPLSSQAPALAQKAHLIMKVLKRRPTRHCMAASASGNFSKLFVLSLARFRQPRKCVNRKSIKYY